MEKISAESAELELKKRKFFSDLATGLKSAFALHKETGQMREDGADKKRPWGNVSEHCLVEVARVRVLSDLLKLNEDMKMDLMYAAALHDISKRREKELPVAKEGITWEQYDKEVGEWSVNKIKEAGFSQEINELSDAMGHGALKKAEELLEKDPESLTEYEKAYLAMHYVDGYTRGSEWVAPIEGDLNEIDLRAEKNKKNPTLANLIKDGRERFGGQDYNDVMRDVGHKIENLFAEIMTSLHTEDNIDPLRIPEIVDAKIKEQIAALELDN